VVGTARPVVRGAVASRAFARRSVFLVPGFFPFYGLYPYWGLGYGYPGDWYGYPDLGAPYPLVPPVGGAFVPPMPSAGGGFVPPMPPADAAPVPPMPPAAAAERVPPPAPAQQEARLQVFLPDPNAQVWLDGYKTTSTGAQRLYITPPLERGSTYAYTLRVSWGQGAGAARAERQVQVRAGQTAVVDFTRP
jgi:uncharacterized protein (TIGR03000 family)